MATFELKIYDGEGEVVKEFSADKLRWGTLMEAVRLDEDVKSKSAAERLAAISGFVKSLFPGMKDEDLSKADVRDVLNTFGQVLAYVNGIDVSKSKNS